MALLDVGARPAARLPAWLRLAGPAIAVSIGYIDPGNWASDIAAGTYGFRLLWAVVIANVIAIVLQIAVSRVTVATGTDLATAFARRWPRYATPGWALFQGAVMATDVAEFTGIVLGAQLLFGLSTATSVVLGIGVVTLILALNRRGLRWFDVAMITALAAIAAIVLKLASGAGPDLAAVTRGAVVPSIPDGAAVLVIVSIVGATVMPHNLFLHSALIHRRLQESAPALRPRAGRFFDWETVVALNVATVVNGAILVIGASIQNHPATIGEAFAALRGGHTSIDAAALFGAGLLISGIAASCTATLSGDSICSALAPFRFPTALRRAIAILPAAGFLLLGANATALLLWSQVALCAVLPAAVVPLIIAVFESNHGSIGTNGRAFRCACVLACGLCMALDVTLLVTTVI